MAADDAFRRRILEEVAGYTLIEKWKCSWEEECRVPGSAEHEFSRHFRLGQKNRLPLRQRFSESELLTAIRSGRTQGILKASVLIPPAQRRR